MSARGAFRSSSLASMHAASPTASRGGGRPGVGRSSRGRGRGGLRSGVQRVSSPDPTPTTTALAAARDPTQATNKAQYMKYMTDLFQKLKDSREGERKAAIRDGFLADPEKKTTLAEAITPVGTCQDMCPEFERVERIVQHAVDKCERNSIDAADGSNKVAWEPFMIKRFRRSAAGTDDQIPSDIRPPLVLKKTLDYLLNRVVGGPEPLADVHKFVWDRTRAIRNDFSIQQVTKVEDLKVAIECFERIARFHLLSLHQLSHPTRDNGDFDAHQEREQLGNTLLSLMYYYDDSRKKFPSPNEAEFRAYGIIFEIQDRRPDIEHRVQTWPKSLLQDLRVQTAIELYAAASNVDDSQGPLNPRSPFAIAQANFGRFWSIIRSSSVSYLAACAAEIYFNHVRSTALGTIYKSYRRPAPAGLDDMTLDVLSDWLGFDNEDQTQKFCEDHGFTVKERDSGIAYVDLSSVSTQWLNDANTARRQIFSKRLVEAKRHGRILPAVIKGYSVARCKAEGLLDTEEDTLFLSDDEKQDNTVSKGLPAQATIQATKSNPFAASSQTQPLTNPFAKQVAQSTPSGFPASSSPAVSPFQSLASQTPPNPFAKSSTLFSPAQPSLLTSAPQGAAQGSSSSAQQPLFNPFKPSETSKPSEQITTQPPPNPFLRLPSDTKQHQNAGASEANGGGPSLLPLKNQQSLPADKLLFQSGTETSALSPSTPAQNVKSSSSIDAQGTSQLHSLPQQLDQRQSPDVASTQASLEQQQRQKQEEEEEKIRKNEELRKQREEEAAKVAEKRRQEEEQRKREQEALARKRELEQQKKKAAEALALKQQREAERNRALDNLAYKYTTGDQGVLHMFMEMLLQPIATKCMEKVAREQEKARALEARQQLLAVKYFKRWRVISYNRGLARSAKARRKRMADARQEGWRSRGNSRASSVTSVDVGNIPLGSLLRPPASAVSVKSETTIGKRKSLPPGFPSTDQRRGNVPDNHSEMAREVKKMKISQHSRSQTASGSMPPPSTPGRNRQDAILSRSTDRLLHSQALPNESMLKKARRLVTGRTDTTQTDYFRLKSMGISPDTPVIPETRKRPRTSDHAEDAARQASRARTSPSPPAALLKYSSRSSSRVPADANPTESPAIEARGSDEDGLFAKVREVRRAMAESEDWFKSTRQQYEEHEAALSAREASSERPPSTHSTPSRTSIRHQTAGSHGYLERWEQIQQRRAAEAAVKEAAVETANMDEPEEFWFGSPSSHEDLETPLRDAESQFMNGMVYATESLQPPAFGGKSGASAEDAIEL